MKYIIKVSNPGGHYRNPLLALDGQEYATRDEACEAIYSRLYDDIDSDRGCEMVDRAPDGYGTLYACDCDGNNAEPLNVDDDPYSREDVFTLELGSVSCHLREATGDDNVAPSIDYVAVNESGKVVGYYKFVTGYHLEALERYINKCRDYIYREGYASEDGVSATVVEM